MSVQVYLNSHYIKVNPSSTCDLRHGIPLFHTHINLINLNAVILYYKEMTFP